ncbi:hypothetical protein AB0O34_34865 [Sphaerisporangium sp. NPDC088356]|uniref:hypothetical protein n=1 Tax=Sphaerisporangium sp. NPDC088356 TaxID=3154871 RepID=UPI003428B941
MTWPPAAHEAKTERNDQWRAVRKRSDELSEVVAPVPKALRKAIQTAEAAAAGV